MSIAPLNILSQTPLVPQSMLGYTSDSTSAIQINPNSITLGGNLLTDPIYVEISGGGGLTTTRINGLDVNCSLDMNNNNITSLGSLIYNNGINIQNGINNVNINSDEDGNLDLYINKTNTDGGLNIYNENGAYMTFYGDGIAINDAINSIVGTNPTGLTLNSDTSITLNAPIISIPNLVVTIPSDLILNSLTYSNGINIQDDFVWSGYNSSITSAKNPTTQISFMDISVNNGATYSQLNLIADNTTVNNNLIFQNEIRIMDSLSQSAPNIMGNGNSLTFTSDVIYFESGANYFNSINSTSSLTLISETSTGGNININTLLNGTYYGTINLNSSQTIMSGTATCNTLILNNLISLPSNPIVGTISCVNNSLQFYNGTSWIQIA
jgi:hypothetical protein